MDVDDKSIDQLTNLSLTLDYSNPCIQRILNNDPGAGANAASVLDMTFVAANALSELVWSPQQGLYLKCADHSFSNKEPSLLYDVGTINMASGSSSDKPISITDKPISKEIFMASFAACNLGSEVAGEDNSTIFLSSNAGIITQSGAATGDNMEEMKNEADIYFLHKEDQRNNKGEDGLKLDVVQNYPTCEEPIAGAKDVCKGTHALGMKIAEASDIHATQECKTNETKVHHAISFGRGHEKMTSIMDEDSKGKMVTPDIFPSEKTESTSENDLENPVGENDCVTSKIVAVESADRFENNIQQGDGLLREEMTLDVKESSTKSRFQKDQTLGKSKVLADEDGNKIMLNEEDGSHESVESCNSTGLFTTGKRQWDFKQQLIVGSKRVKRQLHESPGSSLLVKQDSSFMNWISNMTKGFSKLTEGEAPSLSAAFADPDCRHENFNQDFITCNRSEDPQSRNIGFQSIFKPLYSRKRKGPEAATFDADHETERSKEFELDNKIYDMNATPVPCRMVTGNLYKRFLPISERFNESTCGNQVGPAVHSKDISTSVATIQDSNSNSTVNKNLCNLATNNEKDGASSFPSHGKYNTSSIEKIDSEMPSEGKAAHYFGPKADPLESLWIARFTQKTSSSCSNQNPSKRITGEALGYSVDGMKLKSQSQNLIGSSSEHEIVEGGKKCTEEVLCVQNHGTGAEASFSFYKIKGHPDDKSSCKLNPILPSSRSENSEAMASIFARRLDALKQIMPSDDAYTADCATMTCFFCGIKGHHLQECPEITDAELEDLLRNFNLYHGVKELPCVCIRCFQLNDWAVGCPIDCKRVRNEAQCNTSLVNHFRPSKMLNKNDKNPKDTAAGALTACCQNDSGTEKDLTFNWKSNEAATFQKMKPNAILFRKEIASSSGEKSLKENNFINGHISEIPNGIFDAIRSLRLRRTDILKCMNSNLPPSHLDGFFLRLRLGKWEEGLGGTGYYAACINGVQMESSQEKYKNSIVVNVGGMKCLVESQYVSNHDFLEDELRAWWSDTLWGNDKIPSEEELRLKVKEKKMLGF